MRYRPSVPASNLAKIAIFLVPVTVTVHGVLMMTAPDETMQRIQLSFFLKGITMAGAALIFTQVGVSRAR